MGAKGLKMKTRVLPVLVFCVATGGLVGDARVVLL
jgi:hypothetical protein